MEISMSNFVSFLMGKKKPQVQKLHDEMDYRKSQEVLFSTVIASAYIIREAVSAIQSFQNVLKMYQQKQNELLHKIYDLSSQLDNTADSYELAMPGFEKEILQARCQTVQVNKVFMHRLLRSERRRRYLENLVLDQLALITRKDDDYEITLASLQKELDEFYFQRLKHPKEIRADELSEDCVLGAGSYGCIRQVFTADDPKRIRPLAIKLIEKKDNGNGYFNLMDEANIQSSLSATDFVAKIYKTFLNLNGYIGMLMPVYTLDMSQVIQSRPAFVKQHCRFYFANMVICVHVIHKRGFVHRDVKPSNFMLTSSGYLVIGDFGFATYANPDNKHLNDRVGTPNYMSPEMWSQVGHGKPCDIWGLGCCLFELLSHKQAFRGSPYNVQGQVVKQGMDCVSKTIKKFSQDIQDMLHACCRYEADGRPDTTDLQYFAFFSKINWPDIRKRRITAPHVPSS